MEHFKNIIEFNAAKGLSSPENPMLGLSKLSDSCGLQIQEFTCDFYIICLIKAKSGKIRYGHTKYDSKSGCMYFTKPGQIVGSNDINPNEEGFLIFIQEEYLYGHTLNSGIKKYHYFDYEINEALHLSPREEQIIMELYSKIEMDYYNNQDEYTREIILGHIDSILRYSQRFYKRQFIHRSELSGKIATRFNNQLTTIMEGGLLVNEGLPTVKHMAEQLYLSPRYLSDLLKQETGKTAIELIHLFLISEAKNLLKGTSLSVSEIAYNLGFENHPYFSRLFKKVVGVSPNSFKKRLLN